MNRLHCFVIGINHRTSKVEVRDSLGVPESQKPSVFSQTQNSSVIKEMVLLSTCNRVEWYGVAEDVTKAFEEVKLTWSQTTGVPLSIIENDAYLYSHSDAVEHLFRVACSLDSLVVGEGQILGQVKNAYFQSAEGYTTGLYLNHLFQKAIALGKKVRSETEINQGAVSISFAAVEICKKIFQTFESKKAIVVGVGEMARLAATHLVDAGVKDLTFANRTVENTAVLSQRFQAKSLKLSELSRQLNEYDIIISCTGATHTVISAEDIRQSLSKRKFNTQVYVDIAAPRDIETDDRNFNGGFVFSIDDLKNVVDENKQKRLEASQEAERILLKELRDFKNWYLSLDVVPVIRGLRNHFQEVFEQETQKLKLKDNMSQEELLERFSHNVLNKLLHQPTSELKKLGEEGMAGEGIWLMNKLFKIDTQKDSS